MDILGDIITQYTDFLSPEPRELIVVFIVILIDSLKSILLAELGVF